eukprot:CAMPEP_0198733964 /NCGR_PEP_ID=MMETSP1475-20131203/49486_1 /TAXON_ID= ORGANISM="Unidentified sp., Strain CCMP1999" /NCGR_SAMPLE_ID=MMETSP1475 /ASSEMBLY_ACC=CAM_ASM_001111 /LENGTH=80 /DNA_ID=CAMNT_0044497351 /DNA_START=19 /DNA_END=261 /DNA_ORIENTATION=+
MTKREAIIEERVRSGANATPRPPPGLKADKVDYEDMMCKMDDNPLSPVSQALFGDKKSLLTMMDKKKSGRPMRNKRVRRA